MNMSPPRAAMSNTVTPMKNPIQYFNGYSFFLLVIAVTETNTQLVIFPSPLSTTTTLSPLTFTERVVLPAQPPALGTDTRDQ